ncbi:MAG: putative ABC transporter ATP-binding protein YbiT [Chlamydiae bacterium]|nr:putative ABC transporter ATP-binding protein YbiT [Chlamydiota bacterium]
MITLEEISKNTPDGKILFEDVTITFNKNTRYGLTGPNGSGKSTLLKIMIGEVESSGGKVFLPKKVGYLQQNIEDYALDRVIDVVIQGNPRLWEVMQKKDALYLVEMTDEVGMELAHLEEIVMEEYGYMAEPQAEELLIGMGVDISFFEKQMHTLPQDTQFKVLLCQALFGSPEALILDEPTNHLDLDSISWLEHFLKSFDGCLIVTSHDRHFLNTITTQIADIDYETIIIYPGNYDAMVMAKMGVRKQAEHEKRSREKKISQLKEFIEKFRAGTRASQVQSRMREVERLQPQDLKESNIQRPYINFPNPEKSSGKIVIKAKDLEKSFGDLNVIVNFSLEIEKGEKIGIIGNNGKGKTTLLKLLCQKLDPDKGNVELGHNVDMGYFPQNHDEVLDTTSTQTLFDYLKAIKPNTYDQEIRGCLGKMLFSGDDAFKPLSALSGGEKARLILSSLMLKEHNTLFLDEPNNHLDLESVSALAKGLECFQGTVVLVAHDRDLIQHVATKIIAFEKDQLKIFNGTFEEYLTTDVMQ